MTAEQWMHENRSRALSFGSIAAQYDRARPAYPPVLVDTLMAWRPHDVLDVGCGTGKASRMLLERGCEVLGVEPAAGMASVARSHGITVEESAFEEWDSRQRMFDLVMSGQAWHWVEPEAGTAKAGSVLREGGHLAVFWNRGRHQPEVATALDEVYARLAPSIAKPTTELRPGIEHTAERSAAFVRSRHFSDVETHTFEWETEYDRASWIDFIATHSDHVVLPEAERAAIFDAVGGVIDSFGGTVTYHFSTLLLAATRRR